MLLEYILVILYICWNNLTTKMKRLFLLAALCILLMQCETKKRFTVTGNVTGYKNGTVVALQSIDDAEVVDQTTIEDNTFELEGYAENAPENFMIVIYDGDDSDFYSMLLHNENIVISGNKKDFPHKVKISGAKYGEEATKLNLAIAGLNAKRKAIEDEIFSLPEELQETDSINEMYWGKNGKATIIDKKIDSIKSAFVRANPNSVFSLNELKYLLHEFSKDELKSIYNSLSPELKNDRRAKAIMNYATAPEIAVGKKVPDFNAIDENDKSNSMYSLLKKKKYTLIDFTTPHCGYCTLSIPVIKKVEKKHRDKLQVVSVCIDTNRESWEKVNDKENLPWLRLMAKEGRYSKPYMQYNIHGTPTFFLVDTKGTLLHTWSGYRENMEKEFAHLMQ